MKKRKSYEEQSVIMWANKGESYKDAKARLDDLWKQGKHPSQKNKE